MVPKAFSGVYDMLGLRECNYGTTLLFFFNSYTQGWRGFEELENVLQEFTNLITS